MSIDQVVRSLVREEIEKILKPMAAMLEEVQAQGDVVARLAAALGQPTKRGPGRPARLAIGAPSKASKTSGSGEACAVMDCGRDARSKGFCSAHYQKFRMLDRTGRLPSDWVEYAKPNSVKNIPLARGRAGAKALAVAKKKSK